MMIKVQTKFFDEVVVTTDSIITFLKPILGFEKYKKFILIDIEDNESLKCLQSVDEQNVCFILAQPWNFFKDYSFDLDEEHEALLGLKNPEELGVYSIANIPGDLKDFSLNLMAPIILNQTTKDAIQYILNDDKYTTKHFVAR
jgi:flagellar assembly factor FliW